MATISEFPKSDEFSAVPVSSPSNRAVNQVSRSDGRSGRAFVRIAPYILDDEHGQKFTGHVLNYNYSWFTNFAESFSAKSSKTTQHTVMQFCSMFLRSVKSICRVMEEKRVVQFKQIYCNVLFDSKYHYTLGQCCRHGLFKECVEFP